MRYLAAFAFPLFVVQMYEALGVGWATSLLAFIALACTYNYLRALLEVEAHTNAKAHTSGTSAVCAF